MLLLLLLLLLRIAIIVSSQHATSEDGVNQDAKIQCDSGANDTRAYSVPPPYFDTYSWTCAVWIYQVPTKLLMLCRYIQWRPAPLYSYSAERGETEYSVHAQPSDQSVMNKSRTGASLTALCGPRRPRLEQVQSVVCKIDRQQPDSRNPDPGHPKDCLLPGQN